MSEYSPVQLESFVQGRAPQIAQDIVSAAKNSQNEADLVAQVEKLLDRFAVSFDLQLHLQRERTLVNGRADAVYNRLVIEYEPPRSLNKSNSHRNNQHAIQQVKDYMGGLERLDRHKKERLAGVVLDGGFYIFVRYRDDRWFIDDPLPVSTHSTETFLRYLLSLSTEKALTPENLVRDFGENSNIARQVVPVLYNLACCSDNKKVETIFQQWERQFNEISGYDPSSGQLNAAELAKLYAVKVKKPDLERLFFSIHSYYAAFIKLLALQVGHYYLMPKTGTGLKAAAGYESSKLCNYLRKLEAGGLFKELGIRNFLEGDFFGWYLEVWDESIATVMQRLVAELADYSLVTLDVDPEDTRDLLKQLYQNLMPKKLRHALGEYYTPDWLAERLLNQLGYDGNPTKRILDPSCGSGTFPVLEIKRARKYVEDRMMPPAQALNMILENIVGYDLNPLAVISARTNYLLALGDLLEYRNGDITIPIYLCDSIMTPGEGIDLFTRNIFSFTTSVGRFRVPKSLVQAHLIDKLTDLLDECVHTQVDPDVYRKRVLHELPLREPDDQVDINITVELYNQLLDLEKKGINGIWARIVKNAFAPLFQPKFDYIAGNPPWVNWINLPGDYRQDTEFLWKRYNLFQHKGLEARLGGACDDISVLMTYVALDQYLLPKGRLAFIITQSIFKSKGGGEGFRSFSLPNNCTFKIIHVDDMVKIQPFDSASNRTCVFVAEKGNPTTYPVPYTYWKKKAAGGLREESTLDEINLLTSRMLHIAEPIDPHDKKSPWMSGKEKAVKGVRKVIGQSHYRARKGLETSMAGIYRLDIIAKAPDGALIISNNNEAGRSEVESLQTSLETKFVFPYLRGRDVFKWGHQVSTYILVPQDPSRPNKGFDQNSMAINFPKTYGYVKYFENQLGQRAVYRKFLMPSGEPFYAMYNVGDYTFAPYKLLWRYISTDFTCAVVSSNSDNFIGEKTIVPDSKLVLVPFNDEREANYVCALLNSRITQYIVASYSVNTQISTHVLEFVRVPVYDHKNNLHVSLADLSINAHKAIKVGEPETLKGIEDSIDVLAGKIWGLSDGERSDIRESLEELG